ncbi:MAG TPA: phage tail protein [Bryobacteraceae bacterium]|nr:phage tail protein [Bryobacteraceae bacterium]
MSTIHAVKQQEVLETPLLLFECQTGSGTTERWCTHAVTYQSQEYAARVVKHNVLETRAAGDEGIDAYSRLVVTLANADSYFSQIARSGGWKGAKLTVRFLFFDLREGKPASDSVVVFRGAGNPPDEITETTIRLTFNSRMNLQRTLLPQTRIQRRCPWMFPANAAQREEAHAGGARGEYSPFYKCGYAPDLNSGVGNLNGQSPFTSCDYTRKQCIERGMFEKDSSNRDTKRFGGVEFVPSTIRVKTYGEKSTHDSGALENEAKYNDFVPIVYGTAWYRPPIVLGRNDGNLTHLEVLLGAGEIDGLLKVIVNGNELPPGSSTGQNFTATGWFNIVSLGGRNGSFNLDFADPSGQALGDPYGSLSVLSVVVPNRISDGTPLPRVEVLVRGLKLPTYDLEGSPSGKVFTNNPAWVLLDLLRRSGWTADEIDVASFARAADYCAEMIDTADLFGNSQQVARFQCNLVLRQRRSAADVIRAVRNGAGLFLTYGASGLLTLSPESSFKIQQPTKPEGSNASSSLNGGWPAYEFSDGSDGKSNIIRREDGRSSLRVWSRTTAETPNRFTIEFQDEFNEYQQDSLSLVDLEDTVQGGQEVSASLIALGVPNFNQAGRILRLALDKGIRGNTFVDFETGPCGIGLKPGDLITITYLKEGFERQAFRIMRVAPGSSYQTIAITAQIHHDLWYTSDGGETGLVGGGRQPSVEAGIPRPLTGSVIDDDGVTQFGIEEIQSGGDARTVDLSVSFSVPSGVSAGAPPVPLVSLAAQISNSGGSLKGATTYFYALSAVDEQGAESPLSFLVRASIPGTGETYKVTLQGLSFAPQVALFHVYRGNSPHQLLRISTQESAMATFTDDGLDPEPIAPPDSNYHHANFYWRQELQPETNAELTEPKLIGNQALSMNPNEFRGKTVRITKGKGRGQERIILSNTETLLHTVTAWDEEPDTTSRFVVAESGWQFAAMTQTSPVVFPVANRGNATVHISGRSASVHDRECAPEVSPLTRHQLGGAGADTDVPPLPIFGLRSTGRGMLEVSSIGFETLENTRSISAGSLTLHLWNELGTVAVPALSVGMDATTDTVKLPTAGDAYVGQLVQIGAEIVTVEDISDDRKTYTVARGRASTQASAHQAGVKLFHLSRRAFVLPFVRNFFGTPASGSYTHMLSQPDIRVVAAELTMTNDRGNSQTGWAAFTETADEGIRTLSGGQIALQVDGVLAVQSDAVPALTIDAAHAVRDVFATIQEVAVGSPLEIRISLQGESWCTLTIAAGETVSNVVNGRDLPVLASGAKLGLDIVATGRVAPGAGLTVCIRL